MEILSTLADLARVASIHGHEEGTASVLAQQWRPWLDESRKDTLGNFIGLVRGTGPEPRPKIMLLAHMDTVGLMVTGLEEGGFLRVTAAGGVDRRLLLGQEVDVCCAPAAGGPLTGVIGAPPPHMTARKERERLSPPEDLFVDTGLEDEEVRPRGGLGTPVLYRRDTTPLRNGRVAGRYLDDTAGLAALGVALEHLRELAHPADVFAVGTVGEESGAFPGAATSAFGLGPDAAIAVDVTFASTPGADEADPTAVFPLQDGPVVGLGPNCHPRLTGLVQRTASRAGIPLGLEVLPRHSGTDAWGVQTARGGIATTTLSIPIRYMHTPVETVSLDVIAATGHLLALTAAAFDRAAREELTHW